MPIPDALSIRELQAQEVEPLATAFKTPATRYATYLAEQKAGQRTVLVATVAGEFTGYLTILWLSGYPLFQAAGIPEIADFNVIDRFRRGKIGTRLMDVAEERIAQRSPVAGIGVGMDPDYGPAQRLYVLRGYVPDGRGLTTGTRPVRYGDQVVVDDGLVLYFTKNL